MAEFWSNNDRGYRIRLWIDQTSQNIAGNSSQVRVMLALLNTTTTFSEYSCSAYVDLNGQRLNWSGSLSMLSYNQTIMLIDQTITVGHNADGTKSFGLMASFSGSGGWSPGTLSIGGNTFTLTTIPRSSSVSVGAGVIGSAVTININRQSSSFKHTVRYAWGNKSGTIASNIDTSTTWTIPLDFANDIPNSTSWVGTIYVDTYSGSTKTGTQSTTLTASVPSSMKPTFTGVTLTDTNTAVRSLLTSNNFLQIISNIQVAFNGASGSYGSSITGYKAEIVGKNQATNSNGGSLGIMNFNGSATIRTSVVDNRGIWSDTKDVTINVIEYFAPILNFTALRTSGKPSIIQIVRNAKIAPITLSGNQKNVMTLAFKVAPLGSTTYTANTGPASGSWTTIAFLTNSPANLAGNYLENKSFTVVGTLSDKFTSVEFSTTISTESVVMSYDKDGRMAISKIADTTLPAGSFEAVGNVYASDMFIAGKALRDIFYSIGSGISMSNESAGYSIKIGGANSKLNFVSENGQGFDFTGPVSFNGVPMNTTSSVTVALFYGITVDFRRQGNLVIASIGRQVRATWEKVEDVVILEKVPSGYRPSYLHYFGINRSIGSNVLTGLVMGFEPNGNVRVTIGAIETAVFSGSTSYFTEDPLP